MIEIIIGAVIGAVVSLAIAETYHRRSSRETKKELDRLAKLNDSISAELDEVSSLVGSVRESSELIQKHVVAGTSDDPEYPYK